MRTLILSLLYISISYSIVAAEDNWKLEKDKDGIKIWTRKTASSNLKEYKGIVTVQSNVEKLIAFFKNYKMYEKWMYKADAGSVKLIKIINDDDFFVRFTMTIPMIKSRESITHFLFNQPDTKGTVLININTAPDLIPVDNNYVRIPKMSGYWKLVPLANGKTEVIHQAPVVAGGSIPDGVVNLGAVDAPFSMLTKLKELVR